MANRNKHAGTSDPLIGILVRGYRITLKLAEGGMGAVYLAEHERLANTRMVIKVLLPEYAQDLAIRARFEREADAIAKLKHPNIVRIHDFGTFPDGQLYLTIEHLEGKPLDAYLRSCGGRISEHLALNIIVQLCDALDCAHAAGVVHRDLKPSNIFVMTDLDAIKLLDFGIAKLDGDAHVGPHTRSGIAMGTPSYMAVEQYEHADAVTHLADVYSTAIITWEMITGQLPWGYANPSVLYHRQRTALPEQPPEMPIGWFNTLRRALRVAPATRLQSARELAVALASDTQAAGRFPSGAEILARRVPRFVRKAAPTDETVRNASDVDRIAPLLWPSKATAAGVPPLNVATSGSPLDETPAHVPNPDEGPPTAGPTTLTASSGETSKLAEHRTSDWKLALAYGAAAMLAVLAIGLIANRASSDAVSASAATSPLAADPAIVPDAAGAARPASRSVVAVHPAAAAPVGPAASNAGVKRDDTAVPVSGEAVMGTRPARRDAEALKDHAPALKRPTVVTGSTAKPTNEQAPRSARPTQKTTLDPSDVAGED